MPAKRTPPPSNLVEKGRPCWSCPSSDAVALYDDMHEHCFSCGRTRTLKEDGTELASKGTPPSPSSYAFQDLLDTGQVRAVKSRLLTQETCRKWDYRLRINPGNGHQEHLAGYRDAQGHLVGVKVRDTGEDGSEKEFYWSGASGNNLYGRHLWSAGGKILTILEGEIDTLTMSQAYNHQFPVVGVPNGAQNAAKAIAENLEFVTSFDKVVLGFDMDTQGRAACIECARILPPGKAFIAKWPSKDPNQSFLDAGGDSKPLTLACWQAEAYRPDGIVDARSLTAQCLNPPVLGIPWPWEAISKWTFGRRYGELIVWGAGFGIGKTDAEMQVVASTITGTTGYGVTYEPEACAVFCYEGGGPVEVKKMIAGKIGHKRFTLPTGDAEHPEWTREDLIQVMDRMDHDIWNNGGRLFINDAKGSTDWEIVKDRARYLHHAENVRHFFVDPISALTAGAEDERKMIDRIILEGAQLAIELQACVYFFSHLTRPKEGPAHEEGGQTHPNQFRGSNAIGMYTDFLFGHERHTTAESEAERTVATIRMLKDRKSGRSTGKSVKLYYDVLAGTLDEPYSKDLAQFAGGDV